MELTNKEFSTIRDLMHEKIGVHFPDIKKYLIANRLSGRIDQINCPDIREYIRLVENDPSEFQIMIDRLTTNETYFFREEKHFEFIKEYIPLLDKKHLRIWSAASSSGEEAYSIAMTLDDMSVLNYEIFGSDINQSVIDQARLAEYPIEDSEKIPQNFLKKYCVKGVNSNAGKFKIRNKIRNKVEFKKINLNNSISNLGKFDIIFLRNVLIYFDREMKEKIVKSVLRNLYKNGILILSLSESIIDFDTKIGIERIGPSIFMKCEDA